jgi:hypothetical protein
VFETFLTGGSSFFLGGVFYFLGTICPVALYVFGTTFFSAKPVSILAPPRLSSAR